MLAIGAAFALSLVALSTTLGRDEAIGWASHSWVTIGDLDVRVGIIMDPLTAIMLVVVTGVSLLVQVYSHGYMRGDPSYSRYFAFMSLFTASMIGIVLARSILQLYVFWELVGLCSYLLIGFWYQRPAAVAAAKKAFIVTRIGDFGFLIAILYLFLKTSTFGAEGLDSLMIEDINVGARLGLLGGLAGTWLAVGIFAGAMGKSAQFPLHVWLPDAMEGPTPVSSLIHAATMVAAGVFLVARFLPVFEASADAMRTVALVGAFTALFAATMGLVSNDIKRVLAYSTVSQLGYMMAALGVGALGAAVFHLFNHAFFKALLFMGAGSVNHATGTFDMRYMGGLRRVMPLTYITMMIGSLSLAGIFPFSGFWSKDEILLHAGRGDSLVDGVVFWALIVGVFLTAVYAFRMIFMTFHGQFRGGVDKELEERAAGSPAGASHSLHLGESPWSMILPMLVLGVASVVSGYIANPFGFKHGFLGIEAHWFSHFLGDKSDISVPLAGVSVAIAAAGMALAAAIYVWPKLTFKWLSRPVRPVHKLLSEKYYMDHLYERQVVARGFYRLVCGTLDWFDRNIVDSMVETVGLLSRNIGGPLSLFQTGRVQEYAVGIAAGITLIVGVYLIWG